MAKCNNKKESNKKIIPNSEGEEDRQEFLWNVLNRTDSWINNCDSKIGILAGIVGVMITIGLTTDTVEVLLRFLRSLFCNIESNADLKSILFLLPVAIDLLFTFMFTFHLLKAIIAKVNEKEFRQDGLVTCSNIFFGSISTRTFKEYEKSVSEGRNKSQEKDIESQIYITSVIAKKKYNHYNKAVLWLVLTLIGLVIDVFLAILLF